MEKINVIIPEHTIISSQFKSSMGFSTHSVSEYIFKVESEDENLNGKEFIKYSHTLKDKKTRLHISDGCKKFYIFDNVEFKTLNEVLLSIGFKTN